MDKELFEKITETAEKLGWSVTYYERDSTVNFSQYSPAGEDFFFEVSAANIVHEVYEYAESFDPDEHAEMWVEGRGKRGVPDTIRELIDDAEEIKEMLKSLADALDQAESREWKKTKTLNVVLHCMAYCYSTIEVPEDMTEDEALQYAKEHIGNIPLTELSYLGDSASLDEVEYYFTEE